MRYILTGPGIVYHLPDVGLCESVALQQKIHDGIFEKSFESWFFALLAPTTSHNTLPPFTVLFDAHDVGIKRDETSPQMVIVLWQFLEALKSAANPTSI